MNFEASESTSILLIKLNAALDAQLAHIQLLCDAEDFKHQRRLFGQAMVALFDILNPIYAEHPSLKPKQLGGSYELPSSVLAQSSTFLVNGA